MKVHVRQDGRDQASLRRALVAVRKLRALHHARFQKPRDVAKEVGVTDVVLEKHHQDLVIDVVEESFDVRFHNPLEVPKHHLLVDESDRVVRASARPESVGTVQKPRLVDITEDVGHDALNQLVLVGGNAERAQFSVALGDVHPSDRLWDVLEGFHAFDQALQVGNQVRTVFLLGDSVDARGLAQHPFEECLDFCVQGGFQGGSQSRLSFVYRGLKITDQRLRGTLSRRQKCAKRHAEALHHTLHHSIALVKRSPKSRANCGMADDHLLLARVQVSV